MVLSTERPDGCRPSNQRPGAVLCRCLLGPSAQSPSQGIVRWDQPGRASSPGSAPCQFCSFPRRLLPRVILYPRNHSSIVGHCVEGLYGVGFHGTAHGGELDVAADGSLGVQKWQYHPFCLCRRSRT